MTYEGRQRRRLTATVTDLEVEVQKAFLVGVLLYGDSLDDAKRSLEELSLLTQTAGSDPVDAELLKRDRPDPARFIGKGQAEELAAVTKALDIDVVVFDNDLTPVQQRNLSKIFQCDVVDRVAVILDIFAQHATSKEGMLQVELALLRYHLPRLRGKGTELSRQGFGLGGIGSRGPGETRLETDRRRIYSRVARLENEIKGLSSSRNTQRKARRSSNIPLVALVGYTNAGKSTLLNQITDAGVLTEDRLFSTLGSTVRKAHLPSGDDILLSDTVGFVRRLPHMLVEAFRSTLEEINDATMMLHIVDGSDPGAESQIAAVREVLVEIGAAEIEEQLVFNKIDLADPVAIGRLHRVFPDAAFVSALTGEGVGDLGHTIAKRLADQYEDVKLSIPYDRADVVAAIYRDGTVLSTDHGEEGTVVRARIHTTRMNRFREFAV
ncbi:MAG: GTPase HflX [Acidimicrobiia bacterium]|nr:GTPase HflX [Acidimicrobiia bacterium]